MNPEQQTTSPQKSRRFSEIVAHGTAKRTAGAQELHQWTAQPSAQTLARRADETRHQITLAAEYLFIHGKTIARTRLAPYRLVILSMHKCGASSRRITEYLHEAYNLKINSSNVRRFILKELLDMETLNIQL